MGTGATRTGARLFSVLGGLAALTLPAPAHAIDPFEIQVYDGTANAPGAPGLELHLNYVASGATRTGGPPEIPQAHQAHATFEPSIGVRPWWELGGYFQTALLPDGSFDYAGVKLRSKFVTPPRWREHWRLGLNVEVSLLPRTFDRDRWANELRPIAAYEDERWMAVVNPIVDTPLAGTDFRSGPTFEPALMLVRKVDETLSFGIEYYADLGPISGFASWKNEQHYLYEVFNLLSLPHVEVNVGVGEGLTPSSNGLVGKMILGYVWERDASCSAMTTRRKLAF